MSRIHFHSEDVDFLPSHSEELSRWINQVIKSNNFNLAELNFIFCSDEHLLQINRDYLNHDYYTDIITFDNSESEKDIEGDIFVSVERIKENADAMNVSFEDELHRVLIHGVLHLTGHCDGTEEEKKRMRKIEDDYLALRKF